MGTTERFVLNCYSGGRGTRVSGVRDERSVRSEILRACDRGRPDLPLSATPSPDCRPSSPRLKTTARNSRSSVIIRATITTTWPLSSCPRRGRCGSVAHRPPGRVSAPSFGSIPCLSRLRTTVYPTHRLTVVRGRTPRVHPHPAGPHAHARLSERRGSVSRGCLGAACRATPAYATAFSMIPRTAVRFQPLAFSPGMPSPLSAVAMRPGVSPSFASATGRAVGREVGVGGVVHRPLARQAVAR